MIKLWQRYSRWCETADREVYAFVCCLQGTVIGILGTILGMWLLP